MIPARVAALELARSMVGVVREKPPGSNKTVVGEYWAEKTGKSYLNGVAWCALFVSYCLDRVGTPLPSFSTTTYEQGGCWGLVSTVSRYASINRQWTNSPKPGDIVIFGDSDHTGFFDSWVEPGKTFWSVEGNTSVSNVGSQTNGEFVARKIRSMSWVEGFWQWPLADSAIDYVSQPFSASMPLGGTTTAPTPEQEEEDDEMPKIYRLPSGAIVLVANGQWWTPTWLPQMSKWEHMEAALVEACDKDKVVSRHSEGELYLPISDASLTTLHRAGTIEPTQLASLTTIIRRVVDEAATGVIMASNRAVDGLVDALAARIKANRG